MKKMLLLLRAKGPGVWWGHRRHQHSPLRQLGRLHVRPVLLNFFFLTVVQSVEPVAVGNSVMRRKIGSRLI